MPGEERKLHKRSVPTIGGIIIFSAIIFSYALWFPDLNILQHEVRDFKYLIAVLIILFFIGIKDDIIGTAPMKKLVAHLVVGFILVMMADMRIKGMHGLFGLEKDFPEWASVLLSMFVYIVVVNAFNLIDGIDGLAAGIGLICSITFGILFYMAGSYSHSLLAFILSGSLLGFLFFNFMPARIFMGDSGSLTIGAIISVLAFRLIEIDTSSFRFPEWRHLSMPVMAMAIMAYPLIDTLRVFTVRAYNGQSPFTADKNHLHHRILAFGFNHAQTAIIIYIYSIVVILAAFFTFALSPTVAFVVCFIVATGFPAVVLLKKPRKKK